MIAILAEDLLEARELEAAWRLGGTSTNVFLLLGVRWLPGRGGIGELELELEDPSRVDRPTEVFAAGRRAVVQCELGSGVPTVVEDVYLVRRFLEVLEVVQVVDEEIPAVLGSVFRRMSPGRRRVYVRLEAERSFDVGGRSA